MAARLVGRGVDAAGLPPSPHTPGLMSQLRWLIREIHRRSLWQVALTYLGVSWIVLQVTGHVVDRFELADWAYGAVVLVLLVGLPVVIATAIVQEGPPGSEAAADHAREHTPDAELFRWRNAVFGGIAAGLLVVLAVGGWYALSRWDVVDGEGAATGVVADARREDRGAVAGGPPGGADDVAGAEEAGDSANGAGRQEPLVADAGDADTSPGAESAARFAPAGPAATQRTEPPPRPIRAEGEDPGTREVDRAAERATDRSAYRAALEATDSARALAMLVDAALRAPERWREADSLYRAGLATAAEGSYRTAERDLVLARLGYEDARARALRTARADEVAGEEADAVAAAAGDSSARGHAPSEARDGPGEEDAAAEAIPEPMTVVEAVLGRLEAALEAEDRDALRRVWVTADAEQVENFVLFFRDARELDVAYDVDRGTLRTSADRIELDTRTTWTFRDSDGKRRVQGPFRQHLVLERQGDDWVVVAY